MLNNMLVHGLDPSTRRPQEIEVVGNALKVYETSLRPGDNESLGIQEHISGGGDYKILAANTPDQVCGSVGAVGDWLEQVTLSVGAAGTLTIKDGATTVFSFAFGGAVSTPVILPVKKHSVVGAWKISTGASMTGDASGLFS